MCVVCCCFYFLSKYDEWGLFQMGKFLLLLLFLLALFLDGHALTRQGQKGIFLQNWSLPDSNPPKSSLQFFRRHSKHCVPCGIDFSGLPAHTDFFFPFLFSTFWKTDHYTFLS